MKIFKTKIKTTEFKIAVLHGNEEMKKGLSGSRALKKDAGALFVFKKDSEVTMNTHKMNYTLNMIFLDSDFVVVDSFIMTPGKEITVPNVTYVLEVNPYGLLTYRGQSIQFKNEEMLEYIKDLSSDLPTNHFDENIIVHRVNDIAIFKSGGKVVKPTEEAVKIDKDMMQVLDDKGTILMNIKGGERIFSRKHTDKLIALAKKVEAGEIEPEELGKVMKEIIHIQDTQEPEYVYE